MIERLEAVITCVDYGDFLKYTLPKNMVHFDRIVVVTSPEDNETKGICRKLGISCTETTVHRENGHLFNKGRLINLGLAHLEQKDWIVHMDADILVPDRLKFMLNKAPLDKKCIYGLDRVNCVGKNMFDKIEHLQWQHHFLLNPPEGLTGGSRLIHWDHGYCPIGYFQLFHSSTNHIYPTNDGTAEHTDVLFAVQWERKNRHLLPEGYCIHLESMPGQSMGVNWKGRKTPRFDGMMPQMPPNPPPVYC